MISGSEITPKLVLNLNLFIFKMLCESRSQGTHILRSNVILENTSKSIGNIIQDNTKILYPSYQLQSGLTELDYGLRLPMRP